MNGVSDGVGANRHRAADGLVSGQGRSLGLEGLNRPTEFKSALPHGSQLMRLSPSPFDSVAPG